MPAALCFSRTRSRQARLQPAQRLWARTGHTCRREARPVSARQRDEAARTRNLTLSGPACKLSGTRKRAGAYPMVFAQMPVVRSDADVSSLVRRSTTSSVELLGSVRQREDERDSMSHAPVAFRHRHTTRGGRHRGCGACTEAEADAERARTTANASGAAETPLKRAQTLVQKRCGRELAQERRRCCEARRVRRGDATRGCAQRACFARARQRHVAVAALVTRTAAAA